MIVLDCSSLKCWEFVAKCGFVGVIVGVAGESAELIARWVENCRRRRLPKRVRRWILPIETFFFTLLVAGLAVEFMGSQEAQRIADAANARLGQLAADANERAAMLESNNIELAHQLIQLQKGNFWRSELLQMQSDKFRRALKEKPPGEVLVLYFPEDDEAEQFAVVIMNNLDTVGWAAKFGPIPPDFVAPVFRQHPEYARPTLQQRATGNIAPLVMVSRDGGMPGTVGWNICRAFESVGFNANPAIDDSLTSNKVVLVVGKNEPPRVLYKTIDPVTKKPWNE